MKGTFQLHGLTWTRHTPGDPMPCDGDTLIFVVRESAAGYHPIPLTAGSYNWGKTDVGEYVDIVGWQYAEKIDPYAKLKHAYNNKCVIEVRNYRGDGWTKLDSDPPSWLLPPDWYRAQPGDTQDL